MTRNRIIENELSLWHGISAVSCLYPGNKYSQQGEGAGLVLQGK